MDITKGLLNFADAINALSWAEMVKISEFLASEVPHLIKSEKLDRDGMAQVLFDIAVDIEANLNKEQ